MVSVKITSLERTPFADASPEAKEIISKVRALGPGRACIVQANNAYGYRPLEMTHYHFGGFNADSFRVDDRKFPAEVLSGLTDLPFSLPIVPQTYASDLGKNVRFGVLLPAGYDVEKASSYGVVALLPTSTRGFSVARDIEALRARADELRKRLGRDDLIVVCLERHEYVPMSSAHRRAIENDVMRWVSAQLGVPPSPEQLLDWDLSVPAKPVEKSRAVDSIERGPTSWSSQAASYTKREGLTERLADDKLLFVVMDGRSLKTRSKGAKDADGSFADRERLRKLTGIDRPVSLVARSEVEDRPNHLFVTVLPPNFDPDRAQPYAVKIALPAPGESLNDLAAKLPAAFPKDPDTIVIAPEIADGSSRAAGHAVVEDRILSDVQQSLKLDLDRCSVVELPKRTKQWTRSLGSDGEPIRVRGVRVQQADGWPLTARSDRPDRGLPSPRGVEATGIPQALQRQSATEGTLFAPVMQSRALNEPIRFGVYLPPGFDPASDVRYPTVLMLPGKGSRLQHWDNVGHLKKHLDQMMQGKAQKMVVVIAEGNDSFWYDYDRNGSGSFHHRDGKTDAKRNYEGHLIDELVPYALKELHADPDQFGLYGISRGGFGALHLFARHPLFKALFVHSADATHDFRDGQLGERERMLAYKHGHFGDASDPVWKDYDPVELAKKGAFRGRGPMALEIGVNDKAFVPLNIVLSKAMEASGSPHTLRILSANDEKLDGHNWTLWEGQCPRMIGFFQEALGGAAGEDPSGRTMEDVTRAKVEDYDRAISERDTALTRLSDGLKSGLTRALELVSELSRVGVGEGAVARPYESSENRVERPGDLLVRLADIERRLLGVDPNAGARIREQAFAEISRSLDEVTSSAQRSLGKLKEAFYGELPVYAPGSAEDLEKLSKDARSDLRALISLVPEVGQAVYTLAKHRPELFAGEDKLVGRAFARGLLDFAKNELRNTYEDREGFAMFLDRMLKREWYWRRDGYSNSVNAATSIAYEHPGLILEMITAGRQDRSIPVHGVYDGDGQRRMMANDNEFTRGDANAGFSHVDDTRSRHEERWLPPARLGYERAFLRVVEDELRPSTSSIPKHRGWGKFCGPVSIAMSKITGDKVFYGYCSDIEDGGDIEQMLKLQSPYGLSFSNVDVDPGDGIYRELHFPMFNAYDPETRTALLQDYRSRPQRVKLENLRIRPGKNMMGERSKDIGVYYRERPGMDEYLTPERQPNWDAIKAKRS
jgi:S-formylglutathione hydrolase FrmB